MNHRETQQKAFASREGMRSSCISISAVSERRDTVVCPKPRRISLLNLNASTNDHPLRSLRCHVSHQVEVCESKPGTDILNIILTKGGSSGSEQASPPPFFSGSPPSKVSNPLTQDSRFREDDAIITQLSPLSDIPPSPGLSSSSSPASSSTRKGVCLRASFGNNPATRIEGFDCLDRDRRNCSIPALA